MSEPTMEYNLPGVLHYLQAEWRKFEREKNEWAIERAELQARIALLEANVTTTPEITKHVDHTMKEKSRQVLKSCLQEINYLTSFPNKLPLTNALATRSMNNNNAVRKAPPVPAASNTSSPVLVNRKLKSKSSPKRNSDNQKDVQLPVNVDEVAMINNIKEETENYNPSENNQALSMQIQEKFHLSEEKVMKLLKHAGKGTPKQDDNIMAGGFDPNQIGEIDGQDQVQPKIWKPRITIKGHLDSVRTVCFHPNEMIAASGSDDGTVKVWNLQRTTGKDGSAIKKGSLEEADPSITFRGHTNVVTAVAISAKQNRIYSASLDSTIRVWNLPSGDSGPFSPVDPSLNITTYIGHTDAIWDFRLSKDNLLASASADGTVKIWDTESTGNLLKSSLTFDGISSESRKDRAAPTSVDFCPTETNKIIVAFANAKIRMFDIETGQVLMTFKGSDDSFDSTFATQINRIVSHPTMPIIVSGHEDRHIKFYDLNTGECIQTMAGHLDAVTSLDINAAGTTMVSGGHDSSIRLWDLTTKTCIQEFSAHRRKGDEGVLSAKFHPSFPWMVSGGADGIVKIYNHGH
ncbi:hypothetical protein HPULCUR_004359 [Helicostylum pulchrum]|uniref:Striatin N-terminal domain-containing protein n=1 Tax=Helicostylum pulchrum TaxID=562976 RepID=A0ABP9XXB0_9FUNG